MVCENLIDTYLELQFGYSTFQLSDSLINSFLPWLMNRWASWCFQNTLKNFNLLKQAII